MSFGVISWKEFKTPVFILDPQCKAQEGILWLMSFSAYVFLCLLAFRSLTDLAFYYISVLLAFSSVVSPEMRESTLN